MNLIQLRANLLPIPHWGELAVDRRLAILLIVTAALLGVVLGVFLTLLAR